MGVVRRAVTLPDRWRGRRALLRFGAVDYRAMVWVNGQLAGTHEGGSTPFWLDVTGLLRAGANTVVVRAEDPPADRSIPRGKQFWEEKPRGIFYTRTSGIWQPVWLEAVGDSYLEGVRTRPGADGVVTFDLEVARGRAGDTVRAEVRFGGTAVASAEAGVEGRTVRLAAAVANPRRWHVGRPTSTTSCSRCAAAPRCWTACRRTSASAR